MTTKLVRSICFAVMAAVASAASREVLLDRDVNGVRNLVVISGESVTMPYVESFYSSHDKAYALSIAKFFESKFDASRILVGKGATDRDSSSWYEQYTDYVRQAPSSMGEIIQVGPDVLARTVRAGSFEQKVLRGNNPLICVAGESGCEVIWISVGIIPPHQEKKYLRPRINLFVKTERLPSIQESQRLSRALQRRFDTQLLIVSFRTDSWFIEDAQFPITYPFKSDLRIIHPGDINIHSEVTCASVGTEFRCSAS